MKPRLKTSRAVRELIMEHEPFHETAVQRGRRYVVGYGHTAGARDGVKVTREEAELLLYYDVLNAEETVRSVLGEGLEPGVRDALVSFAASIGSAAFKVSDVVRLAKNGRHREAISALETWVRAEEGGRLVVSDRLVARREAEKELYRKGLEPAPTRAPAVSSPVSESDSNLDDEYEDAPRLGPLVEVDIEFEVPVEETEPAPRVETRAALPETHTALSETDIELDHFARTAVESGPVKNEASQARPEDAQAEEAEPVAEEPSPENPKTISGSIMTLGGSLKSDSAKEADSKPAETQADEVETRPAARTVDPDLQSRLLNTVVNRISKEMTRRQDETPAPAVIPVPTTQDTSAVTETAQAEAEEASGSNDSEVETEAPSEEAAQLGYSYLEPDTSRQESEEKSDISEKSAALKVQIDSSQIKSDMPLTIKVQQPETSTEKPETTPEPAPKTAETDKPVETPVTASVEPRATDTRLKTGSQSDSLAPRAASGMSGEAAGAGPFDDPADNISTEDDELDPSYVAGKEAAILKDYTPPVDDRQRGGRWVFVASFVIGLGLAGVGLWDLGQALETPGNGPIPFWLVSLAMGVVVSLASAWFFTSTFREKKSRTPVMAPADETMTGVSGEV